MAATHIDQFEAMHSANSFSPRIWLTGAGEPLGQLIFYPNGKPLPVDTNLANGQVNIFYHLDDFANVQQMLTTEKNVSICSFPVPAPDLRMAF